MAKDITIDNETGQVIEKMPLLTEYEQKRTRQRFVPKLFKFLGRIPFADDLAAAYYCALDPATPKKVKGVLFAALGYFVLPADILPDFLVTLGFTDDATVLATALAMVGSHINESHRKAAQELLRQKKKAAKSA